MPFDQGVKNLLQQKGDSVEVLKTARQEQVALNEEMLNMQMRMMMRSFEVLELHESIAEMAEENAANETAVNGLRGLLAGLENILDEP